MTGPQYTSCVEATDFSDYSIGYVIEAGAIIGGVVTFAAIVAAASAAAVLLFVGWGIIAFLMEFLYYTCDWMLNKKLICLHMNPTDIGNCEKNDTEICAIGEVGDIEIVGEDKNFVTGVDNDYCINLILAPVDLSMHINFSKNNADENLATANANLQGNLIVEQPYMPRFSRYGRDFVWAPQYLQDPMRVPIPGIAPEEQLGRAHFPYMAWTQLFGHGHDAETENALFEKIPKSKDADGTESPRKYDVPVLHCEFEGSRIKDILDAMDVFSFGGNWCKKNWLFNLVCKILRALFAPAVFVAVLAAYWGATGGSQDPALADPAAGEVRPYDMVVMRGRWAYDGGHDGWNEMHAVHVLQKVYNIPEVDVQSILKRKKDPANPNLTSTEQYQIDQFEKVRDNWCKCLCEVPPDPKWPGLWPLTAAQEEVLVSQQRPDNQWRLHPAIDSCEAVIITP
jgi:hypothetical protein